MAFVGHTFTWNNTETRTHNVQARLDRFNSTIDSLTGLRNELHACKSVLTNWNAATFGDRQRRLQANRKALTALYNSSDGHTHMDDIKDMERIITKEEDKEEQYWQ
ncbi:Uncharacterized protein Fot_04298 [Forsythia ovata]|uniref:Uncharacterized protein n=1 Tax=Forsythia ovata TaxID=205694 RepID=A0ABD1XC54_9LAMI